MSTETTNRVITVLQQVCAAEHMKFPANVTSSTKLSSLGINSLLFIKFVVRLEVEFDIDFDDENIEIKNFVTLNDIVTYVEQQTSVA